MAQITLKQVSKTYDNGVKALQNIDFTVTDHDFLVLLGPSGCGKSTLLRIVAGLETVTEGQVFFDDTDVTDKQARDRNVSMVFQNFALYPHLNVYKNIAFPLKSKKVPKEEIKRRVETTAEILDITHVLNRRPKHLSGGQRQRVALGRAMVREPVVFLLDEPLSNLDAAMRVELRDEIMKLHDRLQTTFIYVTHDQAEAMHMGSRVAVMKDGMIVQTGTPQEVYNYPIDMYVGGFIGSPKMNFFASRLRRTEEGWSAQLMGKMIPIPPQRLSPDTQGLENGQKVILGIRPEEFHVCSPEDPLALAATAKQMVPMGAGLHVEAESQGYKFLTVLMNHTEIAAGSTLHLQANPWCIHVFDADSQKNLCNPVYKEAEAE